ncbi:MAG: DUF3916 domain-containing protein [Ruminococcaceae bacterium]|nr:DUF3916 domain-containing protein [Oscillospiraceae bacterium]
MHMKKSRGQRRRLKRLLESIDRITPFQHTDRTQEHFHVPCDGWIGLPKTSGRAKTQFIRAWLAKTGQIIADKPPHLPFCRVVACINEPYLWDSQIIIFYDEDYYRNFRRRQGQYQTWVPIDDKKQSPAARRGIFTALRGEGYTEILEEEDYTRKSRLWFYGEV